MCQNLWENILLTLKGVKFWPFFKFFLVRRKLPIFGLNCSLPFSLRSLDIPALLKSWQKHYLQGKFGGLDLSNFAKMVLTKVHPTMMQHHKTNINTRQLIRAAQASQG
jgi:hypothetical protein